MAEVQGFTTEKFEAVRSVNVALAAFVAAMS
jgi:hypothetical protein